MRKIIILSLVSFLSACSALDQASKLFPPEQSLATKMLPLESFKELKALPKPKGAIPVSVYAYRDQTGQYKPQANVSSFSTAVTQGGTSILMQALSDSEKQRLQQKLQNKISAEGILALQCSESRSQHRNKAIVIQRLIDLLKQNLKPVKKRKKTKTPKKAIEKRLKAKKNNALKKANRKPPKID